METVFSNESRDELLARLKKVFFGESNKNRILSLSLRVDIEDLWHRYGDRSSPASCNTATRNTSSTLPIRTRQQLTSSTTRRRSRLSVQQEVRIVTFPRNGPALRGFDPHRLRRLILGHDMPETTRDQIRSIVARRVPSMLVEVEAR